MKTLRLTLSALLLTATIGISGCGQEPGAAHTDDKTPGGKPTEMETDDTGDPVMDDNYAKEQSGN